MRSTLQAPWLHLGPFTIFDIETTGLSPTQDRIVELAAIRVNKDGECLRFESLIDPERAIPPRATQVHGITDEMVRSAQNFHEIGIKFTDFARSTILVAHNARFDLSFLQESLARTGRQIWKGKVMNTIPLIKQAYPGLPSYSLQYLRKRFGLDEDKGPAHRAFADVEWTLEIFNLTMTALINNCQH